MTERVLLFEEALGEVLKAAAELPLPAEEELSLAVATRRVLARAIFADRDQPPFARSTRDGFAVRSVDLTADSGAELRVIGAIRAGEQWAGPELAPGEALEIMTGAPLPFGADAVVMVEHTVEAGSGKIRLGSGRGPAAGENVVPQGAEAGAGDEVVPAGRVLGAPEIALAATCGYAAVPVYRRPTVAIVATGDELVRLEETPAPWQIRNSNSYSLAALVEGEGAVAERLPIARDTLEDLRARLEKSAGADLLLLSGGVSMGKYDLVEQALAEAGTEFVFTGARIQPGKPVVFGRLRRPSGQFQYFFGLPGNPISTEVCFRLFVAPLLRALGGRSDREPLFAEAQLAEDVRGGSKVLRFLPALLESNWRAAVVRPVPWQGSGDLAANARANGFVVLPMGQESFRAGESVRVLLR